MKPAPAPSNEAQRIAALRRYGVLDTAPERAFDDLTKIAAQICGVPVALVSLVDEHRQWFKSRVGIDATETPRDVAFCSHAIHEPNAIMLVPDSFDDPRFADNPLVTGEPHVRFYAGAPLVASNGTAIGTLCVIDRVPRELSADQLEALRALGRQVVDQLELRVHARDLGASIAETRAAQEQLASVLDAADVLVQSVAPDMTIEFVNGCWLATLGYRIEDLGGLRLNEVIAPECFEHCRAIFDRALAGEVLRVETTLLSKSGERLQVEGSVSCHFVDGRPIRTRGFFREVTEERLLEARAKALTESSPIGILFIDPGGACLYANPRWCELAGMSMDDALGAGASRAVHPGDRGRATAQWAATMTSGEPFSMELRYVANGKARWVFARTAAIVPNATVTGYVVTVEDIHERKMLEMELHEKSALQRAVLDSAIQSVIATSPEGIITVFNRGAERLLGHRAEDVVGAVTPAIIHLESEVIARSEELSRMLGRPVAPGFETVVALAKTGGADVREWTYVRSDGTQVPVSLSVTAIRSADGTITGYLSVATDIAERKRVDLIKDEFIATVSHELRTPLTSIRGALGLIAGGATGTLSTATRDMVDIAAKNSDRLVRLINDILDLEKIQAGRVQLQIADVELGALLDQVVNANAAFANGHGVIVELKQCPRVCVRADEDRLAQVLTNLISNAAKFSPRGGRVEIHVERRERDARINVVDHGPGIPPDLRDRLFEKFVQGDGSDRRSKGGTGLGLSITRELVSAMQGSVDHRATEGGGATFFVDLPLASRVDPSVGRKGAHVLVCEDDEDVALLLRMMLEQHGFEVDVATSLAEARRRIDETTYAAVTIDLSLPDGDGLTLVQEVRAHGRRPGLPFVVVSARAEPTRGELRGHCLGIADWVMKPIDPLRLRSAVAAAAAAGVPRTRKGRPRVLHVEDDEDLRRVVAAAVADVAVVRGAASAAEATALLGEETFDAVVLDLGLPDGSGADLLPAIERHGPIPIIVFSAAEPSKELATSLAATLVKARTTADDLSAKLVSLLGRGEGEGQ